MRKARAAVSALFFVNGALFATWVSRIPAIREKHGFSHGELGLALLAMAGGAALAMPIAGAVGARWGSARVCRWAALGYCAVLPGLAAAHSSALLVATLAVFGACHGALDVAMNAQAVAVEKRYARPIMSSFHALFSAGGLAGAVAGGTLAGWNIAPSTHFLALCILLGAAAFAAAPRLLEKEENFPAGADEALLTGAAAPAPMTGAELAQVARLSLLARSRAEGPIPSGEEGIRFRGAGWWRRLVHPLDCAQGKTGRALHPRGTATGVLALLGVVALCSMAGEGAMADWSGVFLREVRGAGEGFAAWGYAAFSVAMALCRVCGDRLTHRWGPERMVRWGGLLAAAGLTLALLVPGRYVALCGFAAVGLGFATIVPLVFSAAGRVRGTAPEVALATVTTLGYVGFIAGPPVIGVVADAAGLRLALGLIVATSICAAALARTVRGERAGVERMAPVALSAVEGMRFGVASGRSLSASGRCAPPASVGLQP